MLKEWTGRPHPEAPDDYWISGDERTVICAHCGREYPATGDGAFHPKLESCHATCPNGPDASEMNAIEQRDYDEARFDKYIAAENEERAEWAGKITPINGGADPDHMNGRRYIWGLHLAEKCMELTGTDSENAVSDAIGYLLHAAEHYGETPATAIERAVQHFNRETRDRGTP